jgi:hypothetical protein
MILEIKEGTEVRYQNKYWKINKIKTDANVELTELNGSDSVFGMFGIIETNKCIAPITELQPKHMYKQYFHMLIDNMGNIEFFKDRDQIGIFIGKYANTKGYLFEIIDCMGHKITNISEQLSK